MKFTVFFILIAILTSLFIANYDKIYSYTCRNCHNPIKFLESKERSFHNNLQCTTCHSKEGISYWTKLLLPALFLKASFFVRHHNVKLSNCINSTCHSIETIKINKKITFTYDHKKHHNLGLFGDKLLCQNCHIDVTHIFNYKSSKYVCFLCHKISTPSSLKNCLYCHEGLAKKKDHPYKNCDFCHIIEDSDIKVPEENCLSCHKKVRTNFDNINELHTIHKKTKSIPCFSCHNKTIHKK